MNDLDQRLDSRIRQLIGEMADTAPPTDGLLGSDVVVDELVGSDKRSAVRRGAGLLLVGAAVLLVLALVAGATLRSGERDGDRLEAVDHAPDGGQIDAAPDGGASLVGPATVVDAVGRSMFLQDSTPTLDIDPWLSDQIVAEILDMVELGATEQERRDRLDRGALTIQLGLDAGDTAIAEEAIADTIDGLGMSSEIDIVAVTIDDDTGQILAATSRSGRGLGRAVPAPSVRTAVYAAAIEGGVDIDESVDGRGPCEVVIDGTTVAVENFGGSRGSEASLLSQVTSSNLCALARLEAAHGERARRMLNDTTGVVADGPLVTSPPLLNAAQQAALGAAIANGGHGVDVGLVAVVLDAEGAVLFERSPRPEQVIDADAAEAVADTLGANVRGGTATGARLEGAAAIGITGTVSDFTVASFAGSAAGRTTAVWMAATDGSPMIDLPVFGTVTGGSWPAKIFRVINQGLLDADGERQGETSVTEATAQISIPAIDLEWAVVEGVGTDDLAAGPGRYPGSALPGEVGNVAIAGHRTTFGAPFLRLDELRPGDEILLRSATGAHEYRVVAQAGGSGHRIVDPAEIDVIAPTDAAVLTLISNHPRFSARQRIVVRAELVSEPIGPGPMTDPRADADQLLDDN